MLDRIVDEKIVADPEGYPHPAVGRWPRLWWLSLLLLGLTVVSTTVFGFALSQSFQAGRPLLESDWLLGFQMLFAGRTEVWRGLTYALPLIAILLAHEMGHYGMCRKWRLDATLPFFGPSPSLLGTVGAFIWIRSPIYRRRVLFDVGIAGPLLGFLVLLPFLIGGIWNSKVCPNFPQTSEFSFGTPMLVAALEQIRFPNVAVAHICLHPTAMAAWAGLLATAINLLPVGQLDGGHIVYAVLGERGHVRMSWMVVVLLALGGFLYWPWWVWALVMFFFRRHPLIHDAEPIGPTRRVIGLSAILLLVLCFSLVPVRAG